VLGRRAATEGRERMVYIKGCEKKHSHTAAHHPVVKPPAVHSTAVSHTPTQLQGWGKLLGIILESIGV